MSEESLYGQLTFFTFVYVTPERGKRVKLSSVYCEYLERQARLEAFRAMNPALKAEYIHAEFVFREMV